MAIAKDKTDYANGEWRVLNTAREHAAALAAAGQWNADYPAPQNVHLKRGSFTGPGRYLELQYTVMNNPDYGRENVRALIPEAEVLTAVRAEIAGLGEKMQALAKILPAAQYSQAGIYLAGEPFQAFLRAMRLRGGCNQLRQMSCSGAVDDLAAAILRHMGIEFEQYT